VTVIHVDRCDYLVAIVGLHPADHFSGKRPR
jgi:hypothetical protein